MTPGLKINRHRVGQARLAMQPVHGRHVSQARLAEMIGVHWVTLSNIERGKTDPSYQTLAKIADATGKPFNWFLEAEVADESPSSEDDEESETVRVLAEALLDLIRERRRKVAA